MLLQMMEFHVNNTAVTQNPICKVIPLHLFALIIVIDVRLTCVKPRIKSTVVQLRGGIGFVRRVETFIVTPKDEKFLIYCVSIHE